MTPVTARGQLDVAAGRGWPRVAGGVREPTAGDPLPLEGPGDLPGVEPSGGTEDRRAGKSDEDRNRDDHDGDGSHSTPPINDSLS
ncbi:MAG: hypothetical protein ACRD2C_12620 [Acidimicrobiales bacterium]